MDIRVEKKKGFKFKFYVYIAFGILILLLGWKVFFDNTGSTFITQKDKLVIKIAEQGKFDDYIPINGNVAPITTIYIDAYEGGRVVEKLVEEGAMVKKDQVILKLENQNLYEEILASESNLALKQNDLRSTKLTFDSRLVEGKKSLVVAEYELQRRKRNFAQNQELYKDELISKEEYLKSKEDYELSQKQYKIIKLQTEQDDRLRTTSLTGLDSDLERMKKTLSMVYQRLEHLKIKAPADGQLGLLNAEIGQSIVQGARIGQINVLSQYKIEAKIDEHYIDRVTIDLVGSFEKNNKKYPLRLRKVYPEVKDGKFKVDLVFTQGHPETIRNGQSYNIKLQLGESREVLLLPKGNFFQNTGGRWVYVLNSTGNEAFKRMISIGEQNSDYYEMLDGLKAGEKVIVSGYENFGDAERIIIK
ncbi:efflux RND transporter periplasmic adaptor subunit [Flavobacterium sp. WG21]|uniref:efflux RND transporter periplasmic adaptor subunit n=1 Tax=Flavobacterium sp. WG21 TaxID=1229487 RepID=UPI00034676BE|nr:efflux RND transporter periplasmic adaptor subunit [Flavobacterium sp. WG21]